jgi:multiple sugar transport system substrate-binding protein
MDDKNKKKLSRRDFLALAGGTLGAAALVGCGESEPEVVEREVEVTRIVEGTPVVETIIETVVVTAEPEAPAEEGPVTLRWWHVWGGARVPMMDEQVADFQALYPDITVDHLLIDQAGMIEKYLTAMASGDPPDVIMIRGRDFLKFASRDTLVELGPYLARDDMKIEEIFYEAEYKTCQWEGKTFALPLATGGGFYFLFCNMDHLAEAGYDEPPKNWQELEDAAQQLTIKTGDTFERIAFDNNAFANFPFKEWLFLNNGVFISEDGKQFLFDSPEGNETMEWMVGFNERLYGGYEAIAGAMGVATWRDEPFRNGILSMMVHGVWGFKGYIDEPPEFEWAAAGLPYNANNPDAEYANIVEGGWVYGIPKLSKHHDAAWELVKYSTFGDGNLKFMQGMYRCSPAIAHNEDPWFAENNPFWSVVQAALAAGKYSTTTPVQSETDAVITDMREQAAYGKMTPEEAIDWGLEEAQKLLDEYWASA